VQHLATATALIVAAAVFLALGFYTVQQRLPFWWPSLPIPIAAASARLYQRLSLARSQMQRLQGFYHRAVGRVKGMWPGQGFTGDEFNDADHVYAKDLTVFGVGSLFEFLCIARTAIGRRGLANYLLEAPMLDEMLARQEAVRELRPRSDLREKVALFGEFEFSESRLETFTDWLNSPPATFPGSLRVVAAMTSALLLGIVLAGIAGLLPWIRVAIWFSPLILFHSLTGLIFRDRVNRMIESLRSASLEIPVLREGLQLLETQRFQSAKLIQITERVRNGSAAVRKLERLLATLNERNKDWFYQASLLLLAGTQLCMAIEQWRMQHGDALRAWMDAWGEFEALNSLANYAQENPDSAFPEFSLEDARFETTALGHPLLPDETCVRNNVKLNSGTRFYIVSGSNMSGKSSLLRAIGLNSVLAFAGAPVRAKWTIGRTYRTRARAARNAGRGSASSGS
jgi:hypothetical protein